MKTILQFFKSFFRRIPSKPLPQVLNRNRKNLKKVIFWLFMLGFFCFLAGMSFFLYFFFSWQSDKSLILKQAEIYYNQILKETQTITHYKTIGGKDYSLLNVEEPIRVFDYRGELLGEFSNERRSFIGPDEISPYFLYALLSTEDTQFYFHSGINYKSILRATIDIKHPDLETRKAIILKKLEENRIAGRLEPKIIDFLSENITTNIRDIESAVLKIHSLIQLVNEKITIELLENNLSDILTSIRVQKKQLSSEAIKKSVAAHYQISYADLISSKRTKEVSFPRQMAMFLSKELLKSSYAEIGNEFGGRDHSTVVISCRKVEKEIQKNPSIRNDYEELLKILSGF